MQDLLRFNWAAFDAKSGIKVTIGAIVVLVLSMINGETWTATGLVVLFAWLTNLPGSLKDRVGGMLAFVLGAIVLTYLSDQIGLALWPNVVGIAILGLLGTLLLAKGIRAYMVGYVLICWAIYSPFLIESTSVKNCVLAIVVGTGALIVLNVIGALFESNSTTSETASESAAGPSMDFIIAYSITIALVLALTTYLGWASLKTDPTMVVGGAFFVIGFDVNKTWVAGIARVIGIVAGMLLGLMLYNMVDPGLVYYAILIVAFFLCFAAMPIHPGFFMFFFMLLIAMGWQGLEIEKLNLTFWERFLGEGLGVLIAMLATAFLHWWQSRTSNSPSEIK